MDSRSTSLAIVGSMIIVLGLGVTVAVSLPESGSFDTQPLARTVPQLEIQQAVCKSASFMFKDLYSDKFKACTNDSQCEIAVHPVGCRMAIAGEHRETFNSQSSLVRTAMKGSDSNCGLPQARCSSGIYYAVCESNKCVVFRENIGKIDLFVTPRTSGGD